MRVTVFLLLALGIASRADAQRINGIEVRSFNKNDATVTFKAPMDDDVGQPPPLTERTEKNHYAFAVDVSDLQFGNDRELRYYDLFIRPVSATSQVYRFKVRGACRGTVRDDFEEVRFDVSGSPADVGSVKLPIGCGNLGELVQPALTIQEVTLSGEGTIEIPIRNTSAMPITVDVPETLDRRDDDLWTEPPRRRSSAAETIKPGRTTSIQFTVSPTVMGAISGSFFRKSDVDTEIPFAFQISNPAINGRADTVSGAVQIRFRPRPSVLGVFLLAGVILGSLIRSLRGDTSERMSWRRATIVAAAAALCWWVIALLLQQQGTKVEVFHVAIDPAQSLGTVVIGIGCGLLGSGAAGPLAKFFMKKTT